MNDNDDLRVDDPGAEAVSLVSRLPVLPTPEELAQSAVARWLQQEIARQPWYKRKANAITTLGGALATVAAYLATNAVGAPEWLTYLATVVLLVLTVLGVSVTPNGTTYDTADTVQRAVADPLVLQALVTRAVQEFGPEVAQTVNSLVEGHYGQGRHRAE